jgi:hypothetical protein
MISDGSMSVLRLELTLYMWGPVNLCRPLDCFRNGINTAADSSPASNLFPFLQGHDFVGGYEPWNVFALWAYFSAVYCAALFCPRWQGPLVRYHALNFDAVYHVLNYESWKTRRATRQYCGSGIYRHQKKMTGFPSFRLHFSRDTRSGTFQITRGYPLEAENAGGVQSSFQAT